MENLLSAWKAFRTRQQALLGMNSRNLEIIFENNSRKDFPLVNDKVLTKGLLLKGGISVPETYAVLEGFMHMGKLQELLDTRPEFVIKPANGSGGKGVFLSVKRVAGGVHTPSGRFIPDRDIYRHVGEILYGSFSTNRTDQALCEELLHPHPFFKALYPIGLADIRVIVFKGRPVLCMLRLPTRYSKGTANLHQGGVGVGVDLKTGRTMRAICRGESILRHPDSGLDLLGVEVPAWTQVIDVALRAAAQVPLQYLGVDLVLVPGDKVKVLELNARPGLQIQNAAGIGLRSLLLEAGV